MFHKASLKQKPSSVHNDWLNHRISSLDFVTEFDVSFYKFGDTEFVSINSKHLVQLAVTCPNLQQLNLENNKHCLKSLRGLLTTDC